MCFNVCLFWFVCHQSAWDEIKIKKQKLKTGQKVDWKVTENFTFSVHFPCIFCLLYVKCSHSIKNQIKTKDKKVVQGHYPCLTLISNPFRHLAFSEVPIQFPDYPLEFPIKDYPRSSDPAFIGIFYSRCKIGQLSGNEELEYAKRRPGVYFRSVILDTLQAEF